MLDRDLGARLHDVGAATYGPRMLREAKNAGWVTERSWAGRRHVFVAGARCAADGIRSAVLARAEAAQRSVAVPVLTTADGRRYWWCLDRFWWDDEELAPEDVFALAYERQVRAERRLERAHATLAVGQAPPARGARLIAPREVRRAVWERDGGRCVECGSTFDLQYDHVIPVALGGATSEANLQVLCGACNQAKGASL